MEIKYIKTNHLKEKPDWNSPLGFGKYFTDYMFTMDWNEKDGWHNATIEPYAPIALDPATMVLHYAQETFEGLKAYKTADNKVLLFRPYMNAKRFANSNRRLCMEVLPEDMFVEAIEKLVSVEKDWIPTAPDTSYTSVHLCLLLKLLLVYIQVSVYLVIILCAVGAYIIQKV